MKSNLNKKFNDSGRDQMTELERRLITAVEKNDAAEVAVLIKKGVDVLANGEWPQILASSKGYLQIVKLLAAEGSVGRTCYGAPRMHAQDNGHTEVVEFLSRVVLPPASSMRVAEGVLLNSKRSLSLRRKKAIQQKSQPLSKKTSISL
jgi:hypothetical protein